MPTGTSRMALAKSGNQVEAVGDANSRRERALRSGLDHRPVGNRVGEGYPDLDHVRAAFDQRVEQPRAGPEIGIAEHDEGAERALAAEALEHGGVAAHASSACACATSLSPRPERPTRMTLSGSSSASFNA